MEKKDGSPSGAHSKAPSTNSTVPDTAPKSLTSTTLQTTSVSVLVPTSTTGKTVMASTHRHTSTSNPPPLISMAPNATGAPLSVDPSTPSSSTQGVNTENLTAIISMANLLSGKLPPKALDSSGKVAIKDLATPITTPDKGAAESGKPAGGLGAGKPKAFLALMASATKKQLTKKSPGASKTNKGQGNRNKVSPLNPASSKKTEQPVPSRSSNRSIKRPRTYDEDMDELKAMKPFAVKKAKGASKVTKTAGKKSSLQVSTSSGVKDLGRWRPTDDLMLISAVQQTNDLTAVHLGVNFSCRFTLQEVEERWHTLLYSPRISQLAIEAMRALHPGVVTMALNNALWSQEEEAVLARIPSTDPGHLEKFQAVLRENPAVFHTCRTATSLHHHWVLMGHNGLLNNQKVDLIPPEENIKEFADAEDRLEDNELMKARGVREEALEQELVASDRQAKIEIIKLEEELPLWRTVIDTGSPPDFGPTDFALFKGKVVEFRMTKRTVILGRSTSCNDVDFDLSLEGPAFKISRRQASIQLTDNGEFMLHNEGRRPMYVSGRAIVARTTAKLLHNQVLEVESMSFLIMLNSKLASSIKHFTNSA